MLRKTLSIEQLTQSSHYFINLPSLISCDKQYCEETNKKIHEIDKELAAIQKVYLPKRIVQLQQLSIKPQKELSGYIADYNISMKNAQKLQHALSKLSELEHLTISNREAQHCIDQNTTVIHANLNHIETLRETANGEPQLGLQGEIVNLQGNIAQHTEANAGNAELIESNFKRICEIEATFATAGSPARIRSFQEIQRDIKIVNEHKAILIQKCNILQGNMTSLQTQITNITAEIDACKAQLSYFATNFPDITTTKYNNADMEDLAKISHNYTDQKTALEALYLKEEEQLNRRKEERLGLMQNRLITAPIELIYLLGDAMKQSFSLFDFEFPDTQSYIVRKCLCQIDLRINYLMQAANREPRAEAAQFIYYQLYGMLADMEYILFDTQQNPSNQAFQLRVQTLLDQISIHRTRPEFILKNQCRKAYGELKNLRIELFQPKTDEYFQYIEAEQYEAAYKKLTDLLVVLSYNNKNMIEKPITDLLQNMEHTLAKLSPEKKQQQFKYFTIILNKTCALVNINLGDHTVEEKMATLKNYHVLISRCKIGASKTARKIIGAMVTLFGILLSAASVMAKVITLGIPTPFSISGIIAGGAVTLTGIGLFKMGMQKGIAKNLYQLEKGLIQDINLQKKDEQHQMEEQTRLNYSAPNVR